MSSVELAWIYSSLARRVQDGPGDKKDQRSLYAEGVFLEKRSMDRNPGACPVGHLQLEIPLIAAVINAARS